MSSESIPVARPAPQAGARVFALAPHRMALGAILLLATALNVIQLDRVGLGNTYYAAAVKSMMLGWHNFFFVSFDPGGFVTIDKPPVAFWLQTVSAKLFGFNGISLLLPEALAGVLSVGLLYLLVARYFGRASGLLAALALAVTPVMVAVNRSNLVESILVLSLLLSVWATARAIELGRLRWLLLGMVFVGIGFNIKMLEAYLVAPALFLGYLLAAPVRWYHRLWHLVVAAAVLLVVSLLWVEAVDLTPPAQRPYVASSGDNSELSLALGYNGIGRLTGNTFAFLRGGTSLSTSLSDLSPTNLGFTRGETGSPGIQRLLNAELGGQTSWLLLPAFLALLVASWQRKLHLPLDRQHGMLVLWGAWLITGAAFFSVAGTFHSYYLATIAPPVAALAGIAIATLWRQYREPGWRGWALPVVLIATAVVQAVILRGFSDWQTWLTPLILGASIVLALALAALRLRRAAIRPPTVVLVALAVVTMLLAPFIWSEYTVAHAASGLVISAGPAGVGGRGGFGGRQRFPRDFPGAFDRPGAGSGGSGFGFPPPGAAPPGGSFRFRGGGFGGDGAAANPALLRYLQAHRGPAKFLVATLNAAEAEPFILATGDPVMDLGGFSGGDRIVNAKQLAGLVRRGAVRYFLLSGRGDVPAGLFSGRSGGRERPSGAFAGFRGGFGGGGTNNDLTQWVSSHCRAVPASAYSASAGAGAAGFGAASSLYDCGSATSGVR